jgi:tetratricopeptide (TPR) repeat protein
VAKVKRRASAPAADAAPAIAPGRWIVFAAVLAAVTFVAYSPAWHGGLLWDDDAHLTRPELQSGYGLWRIWFDVGATQQYYPLVHSAFWLFNALWGVDTLGYHLVNIALHASSAVLLAAILTRLNVPGAFLAATLFALHPVQVESVAWMTELKNTLSTLCYLASALTYLRFDRTRARGPYAASLLFFIAALLAKSVTASLPAALLVVIWWARGRLDLVRDVKPLVPYFTAGIAAGATTAWFERTVLGAGGAEYQLHAIDRVLLAGRAAWFYLGKLLWPSNLTFIYPRWTIDAGPSGAYVYVLAAAAALLALWAMRHRSRSPLATALLYLGALVPALGFVDVYPFRYSFVADHFQYLATLPMLAGLSAAMTIALTRTRLPDRTAEGLLIVLLGVPLAALTWRQSHDYRDAETLFTVTLARNPSCWLCYNNLAASRLHGSDAELRQAVEYLAEALRLNPLSAEAHNNMGGAYQRLGRLEDALREHREALRLNPQLLDAQYNIGVVQQALGRFEEARTAYLSVVGAQPAYGPAHYNLGTLLTAEGRFEEATRHLSAAARLNPADWQTRHALGLVLLRSGFAESAVAELREAARLQPDVALARYHLAMALATSGRPDEAVAEFQAALALAPGSAEIHHDLAAALANAGRLPEAVKHFEEAVRLKPDYASARQNLARARAAMLNRQ